MGQIIYREYIVFRGSNISCSLACSFNCVAVGSDREATEAAMSALKSGLQHGMDIPADTRSGVLPWFRNVQVAENRKMIRINLMTNGT